MTAPRDEILRQSAAMERVQDLAHAHGFDADADAQQAIFMALLAYAGEERDALCAAVVAEYTEVLARRGAWRGAAYAAGTREDRIVRQGARAALLRVAERLGVTDLHAQAAEVVAHANEEGP